MSSAWSMSARCACATQRSVYEKVQGKKKGPKQRVWCARRTKSTSERKKAGGDEEKKTRGKSERTQSTGAHERRAKHDGYEEERKRYSSTQEGNDENAEPKSRKQGKERKRKGEGRTPYYRRRNGSPSPMSSTCSMSARSACVRKGEQHTGKPKTRNKATREKKK
jgi:hypothetical protein